MSGELTELTRLTNVTALEKKKEAINVTSTSLHARASHQWMAARFLPCCDLFIISSNNGSWFQETDIAVEFFKCTFGTLSTASQVPSCSIIVSSIFKRKGRHLYGRHLQNSAADTKTIQIDLVLQMLVWTICWTSPKAIAWCNHGITI